MEGGLLINLAKIGFTTLFTGKIAKAIGQKEIGQCINGVGILLCFALIMNGLQPLFNGISEFTNACGNFFNGIANFVDSMSFWN